MSPQWVDEDKVQPWHNFDGSPAPQPLIRSDPPAPAPAQTEPDQAAKAAPSGPTDDFDAWLAMGTRTIEQLRRLCLQRGLSAAGDRAALVERLRAAAVATPEEPA